jgi:hypothetical protein
MQEWSNLLIYCKNATDFPSDNDNIQQDFQKTKCFFRLCGLYGVKIEKNLI